ncbi:MAG: hypothetical protein M1816_000358 [Peltula sp. TS41687]|nr:MAG: hypothetical protein M1816_000358 [Peltula sp. TS41687]
MYRYRILESRHVLAFLLLASGFSTLYLYLYPLFHACAFPSPTCSGQKGLVGNEQQDTSAHAGPSLGKAPFRLLALGDPQLEGDSSLPSSAGTRLPWGLSGLGLYIQGLRKRVDLVGNDYYLAHIYRILHWWTKPTHVTVLGDLLGSQWVTDVEFERRAWRFWTRAFRGSHKPEEDVFESKTEQILGAEPDWERKIINIAGNHDIGYSGDMTTPRITRFERLFGKVNWDIWFRVPDHENKLKVVEQDGEPLELRIVILNSLNLDGPVIDTGLQQQTYDFLNRVILTSKPVESREVATILLTHLPLHKETGVCVDGPLITYHDSVYGGGIKEQNHLTHESSKGILEGIFGMSGNPEAPGRGQGRPGIILTGHDHQGCDVYHHLSPSQDSEDRRWEAKRWLDAIHIVNDSIVPGIREITVRSMMGDFGGNAGLLSAWYDEALGQWQFEYSNCMLGVQHIWWAVHILDLVALVSLLLFLVGKHSGQSSLSARVVQRPVPRRQREDRTKIE